MGLTLCSCSAMGALSKLLTEETGTAPRTFNASSIRHQFVYEKVGSKRPIHHTNAITGSLTRLSTGARTGSYVAQGPVGVQASPAELSTWLPRIFGGPTVGTDVPLKNVLPSFDYLAYRENGIFHITDCMVAQAMIRGRNTDGGQGSEFIEMVVNLIGQEELIDTVVWPDPEPALGITVDYLPYAFWESTLKLNTEAIGYDSFTIVVDNMLRHKKFNEIFPTCIRSAGRMIHLEIDAPFTCDNLDKSMAIHGASGTGEFKLTTTGMSTTFAFPALRNVFESPVTPGKVEIPLQYALEAYGTAANNEVVITHDATPPV